MRIGMVCPYSFDVHGGVQSHVLQLAEVMHDRGHVVSVLAPTSSKAHGSLPDYVVSGGKAVPIPYNGSVARLSFGPTAYSRLRHWIAENDFDVLHIHEPNAPSLSMLALNIAQALWTTAAGLVVAIPAVSLYTYFKNRLSRIILSMEGMTMDLIKALRNVEVVEE